MDVIKTALVRLMVSFISLYVIQAFLYGKMAY